MSNRPMQIRIINIIRKIIEFGQEMVWEIRPNTNRVARWSMEITERGRLQEKWKTEQEYTLRAKVGSHNN